MEGIWEALKKVVNYVKVKFCETAEYLETKTSEFLTKAKRFLADLYETIKQGVKKLVRSAKQLTESCLEKLFRLTRVIIGWPKEQLVVGKPLKLVPCCAPEETYCFGTKMEVLEALAQVLVELFTEDHGKNYDLFTEDHGKMLLGSV